MSTWHNGDRYPSVAGKGIDTLEEANSSSFSSRGLISTMSVKVGSAALAAVARLLPWV